MSDKTYQKMPLLSKKIKVNITIECCIVESVSVPQFNLKKPFWINIPNFLKKIFSIQQSQSEHHQRILHIRISQGNKINIKQKNFNFWFKLAMKGGFFGLKKTK